jgi:hypothetical protein
MLLRSPDTEELKHSASAGLGLFAPHVVSGLGNRALHAIVPVEEAIQFVINELMNPQRVLTAKQQYRYSKLPDLVSIQKRE